MPIAHFWNLLVILLRLFLMIWCTCLASHAFAQKDEKALEILEKTSAYYQGLENFRAIYNLTSRYRYLEEDAVQTSQMVITARGQQYRLYYDQKEIITDAETVWEYDKELKEVTISEYAKKDYVVNFAELHNLYQRGYTFIYVGERVVHKTKNKNVVRDVVQLVPEDGILTSITLEIDRATSQIHGWEIVQNAETSYLCEVRSFAVNIPLSDDYFIFDVSAHGDLEIIDLRESDEDACSALCNEDTNTEVV
ncbi:LolA family protein [Candidatus Cardinium hertigii]|nr:outer membrane lipoprotein carrier protein LolA [Candidatus Cardinium hertigii]